MRKVSVGRVARLIMLACFVTATGSMAASAKGVATHAKPKMDPVEVLYGSILLNSADKTDDLFRACNHSDFKTLAWALKGVESKISFSKSEYETEAEFDARKQKAEDVLNAHRRILICQPLDDNDDAPFEYDAERQVFKGTFSSHQNVWRDTKRIGKYVSHTRMGVRATVTSSLDMEYDVDFGDALRDLKSDCIQADYLSAKYEVAVPRAEAPLLKARGYLAFVGHLVYPFFDFSDTPGSPTLDDPHDVYERDMTVHFVPDEAVVVGPQGVRWTCKLAPQA